MFGDEERLPLAKDFYCSHRPRMKHFERIHSTYIRTIHQTRKIATMAPAM